MRYGSLFTGAGGLDLAVHMLWPDAELLWWSEVDEHASASFARHTDAPNLGDITTVDWSTVEPVDVIVGGFPCQDLSHAGKRAGINADRSGLWFHMLAAMNALQPRLALLENVAGIYTATGDDDDVDVDRDVLDGRAARPARALDVVLGSLADNGFDAEWGDMRASDVGAPHQRRRWFCVAWDPASVGVEGRWGAWDGDAREVVGAGVSGRPGTSDLGLTLLKTPTAQLGVNGGSQHPDKRKAGGHGPTLADEVEHLLPTPTVVDMGNNKTVDEWDAWTSEMQARHGNGNGHGRSLLIEARLLPTPRVGADRTSRSSLTTDGQWSAPSLGQAVELAQGILPREYESWDEVQGWHAKMLPTPRAANGVGRNDSVWHREETLPQNLENALATPHDTGRWGDYAPAIARWEAVTGRPAPAPTDEQGRLSPEFVEWMLGWPDGWTVGTRAQRLKQCGNGVVPLQAAHAYRQLLARVQTQEAAA